jgi:DNA-binding CsgD family transcriptional regulator
LLDGVGEVHAARFAPRTDGGIGAGTDRSTEPCTEDDRRDTTSVAPSGDRLVGRSEELAFLRARLAAARAGSGRLVLVCGPAGIGKTRLVEELVADRKGVPVGWGGASADSGMPPLWPWTRAVRGFPALCAAMATVVAGDTHGEFSSAEDAAAATFAGDTAALDALEEAAAGSGILLVLEDIQWADGATLRVLERLAADIRRLALLVVATHRDRAHPVLDRLLCHGGTDIVRLGPLSTDDAAVLLSETIEQADPEAVRHAAARSGGSPLYLRTLTQVAADQLRGRTPWGSTLGAPEFRHLVSAAMRAAGPRAAEAVDAASVLGVEAPAWLVARMLGSDSASDVLEWLRPAVPAGLVEIHLAAEATVCFAHALVRDSVYASLPAPRRSNLHRRAAELLEPVTIGHDERAGAVARHWDKAGRPDRAATWAVRAADAALAAGAYDEAGAYLSLALDALRHSSGDVEVDPAELLLDLARSQYLGGHLQDSLESCERAADEGESSGRADIVARAAIIIQGVGHPTINHQLAQLCRRALGSLDAHVPQHLRARVEAQLACALFEIGEHDDGRPWSRAALAHATASGDPNAELDAIRAHATLTWLPGFHQELLELGRRAIELAEPTRRPLARLWAHVWRSDTAIHMGNLPDALHELHEMKALADRTGLPLVRWHWLRRNATLAALTGDFAGCRRWAAQAVDVAEGWQDESVRGTNLGLRISLALLRGDPADLPSGWAEEVAAVRHLPAVGQAIFAAALALVGRRDEAVAIYQPLIDNLSRLGGMNFAALAYLIELAPSLGDQVGCRAIRSVVSERFAHTVTMGAGTVFYVGSVARALGELDVGCGEYEAAVPHLEEGLAVDAALGARPFLARGRLTLSWALRATGDRERAVKLARTAAADARRLDMPGVVRAADSLLSAAAATARSEDPLTAREREIAQLVAQALSNREVANTLVLSERTVESHVRNILAKTGLRSRTELTRWLLQRPS